MARLEEPARLKVAFWPAVGATTTWPVGLTARTSVPLSWTAKRPPEAEQVAHWRLMRTLGSVVVSGAMVEPLVAPTLKTWPVPMPTPPSTDRLATKLELEL